jgi:two-component system response regulator FlrC
LFYRINVFPLKVPALRERPADIIPLAERFLLKYRASMGQPEAKLGDRARQLLCNYPWPGNVRELENAIQRALLLCNGYLIEPVDLALDFHSPDEQAQLEVPSTSASPVSNTQQPIEPLQDAPEARAASIGSSALAEAQESARQAKAPTDMRQLERDHILAVLRQVGGNRRKAVDMLGISERTLRYKLKVWREAGFDVP